MRTRRLPLVFAGWLLGVPGLSAAGNGAEGAERVVHPSTPAGGGAAGTAGSVASAGPERTPGGFSSPSRGAVPGVSASPSSNAASSVPSAPSPGVSPAGASSAGTVPAGASRSPGSCPREERGLDASTSPSGDPCAAGRLFSTAEERIRLDALRRRHEPPEAAVHGLPAEPEPGRRGLRLRLDGMVLRSRGSDVAWVNGERVSTGGSTREGIRIIGAAGGSIRFVLPGGAGTVRLRAGQHLDFVTGVVRDAWQAGNEATGSASDPAPAESAGDPEEWEEWEEWEE